MRSSHLRAASFALVIPAAVVSVVAACGDDTPSSSSGIDGGGCGLEVCFDGSSPGVDGSKPVTGDDGSPGDAGIQDADPWADADPTCANYTTAPTFSPKSVKIRNLRTTPIYLGLPTATCQYNVGFEFHDQADAAIAASQVARTCEEMQTSCPAPLPCGVNTVTKVERDGGTYSIGWPGTVFRSRYMAKSCYADAGCATGPCLQQYDAPNGDVRVTAYTGFYCDGGSCFDCTAGVSGSCTVFLATGTSGTPLTVDQPYTSLQPGAVQLDFTE